MSDDDAWLDALAGRSGTGEPAARAEATQLRAALMARRAEVSQRQPGTQQVEALGQRVMAAARAEARGRPCALCGRVRAWLGEPWRLLPLGLSALLLAVLLPWQVLPPSSTPERGGAMVQLQDAEPLARRERLALGLEALKVPVARYARLGAQGLEAQVPPDQREAVQRLLAREGVNEDAIAADGLLRIEIASAP